MSDCLRAPCFEERLWIILHRIFQSFTIDAVISTVVQFGTKKVNAPSLIFSASLLIHDWRNILYLCATWYKKKDNAPSLIFTVQQLIHDWTEWLTACAVTHFYPRSHSFTIELKWVTARAPLREREGERFVVTHSRWTKWVTARSLRERERDAPWLIHDWRNEWLRAAPCDRGRERNRDGDRDRDRDAPWLIHDWRNEWLCAELLR